MKEIRITRTTKENGFVKSASFLSLVGASMYLHKDCYFYLSVSQSYSQSIIQQMVSNKYNTCELDCSTHHISIEIVWE